MSRDSVCRICLGETSINSYSVDNIELLDLYEKLTNTKVTSEDRMPKTLCSICHSRLRSFKKFSATALRSERILRDMYSGGIEEITFNTINTLNLGPKNLLNITPIQFTSTDDLNKGLDGLPVNTRQGYYVCIHNSLCMYDNVSVLKEEVKTESDYDDSTVKNENDDYVNDFESEKSRISRENVTKCSRFECDLCCKRFATIHLLKSHKISHSAEKPYACSSCEKSFSRKHNMVQHMKTCNPQKYETDIKDGVFFQCDVCNKRFTKIVLLKSHLITHSRDRPHSCEGCKKSFSRKQGMKQHMKICSEVKPHVQKHSCTYCTRIFTSKTDLNDHLSTHSDKKPYKCVKCNKSFTSKQNMKQHLKNCFTGNELVNCTLCAQTFATRSDLCKHLNKDHNEEKPFICDRCSSKFWNKNHLKLHMRIHTGEKPFTCEKCGKAFTLGNHLKAHLVTHTGEKPYSCDTCGRSFRVLFTLRVHMRKHTGERPFTCNFCAKKFGHQSTLKLHIRKVHMEAKPFPCKKCSLSFSQESALTAHLRVHTAERPYACDICDKTFIEARNLKGHMQVHSEDRPHACSLCGKAYKRREHLRKHARFKCKAGLPFELLK